MWISEALRQPPRGGWTMTGAAWLRILLLALAAVCLGRGLDVVLDAQLGGSAAIWWWSTAGCVAMASLAGCLAEALPGRIQGREELSWRSRIMTAFLADGLRMPVERPAGGHPGKPANLGGHRHAKPTSVDGIVLDAATEGVEKTAFYRAVFLSPTLASFSAPMLVVVIWMACVDLISGLILLPFLALVPVLIGAVGKRLRQSNGEYRRKQAQAASSYLEMIDGLGTLTVLGAIDRAREAFARSARDVAATITALLRRNQLTIAVNDLVFGLLMTGVAVTLLLWRLSAGAISSGTAFAGLLLTVLLVEPIDRLGRNFYIGLGGRASRDGLVELLPESATAPMATPVLAKDGPPGLELRGVSLTKAGKQILHDIDLQIPAGTHLALVGPTGAGKTTLARVLAGLEQGDGEVLVDGRAIDTVQRRAISTVVSQRAGIFGTTIGDNLAIAAPDSNAESLAAAANWARLDLTRFPDGLATSVGEQGALLSGGQRRRIVLARARLRDRPLLILDEPTADLDRRTEAHIRAGLAELTSGKTVIHIAHRLNMIQDADLVAVLAEGKIVDLGTPAELAARPGFVRTALQAEGVGR